MVYQIYRLEGFNGSKDFHGLFIGLTCYTAHRIHKVLRS